MIGGGDIIEGGEGNVVGVGELGRGHVIGGGDICCFKVLHTLLLLHVSIVHSLVYISIATLIIRYIYAKLSPFCSFFHNSLCYKLLFLYHLIYMLFLLHC